MHICSVSWLLKNTFYNFFKILLLRIFSSCDYSSGSVQARAWSVCQAPAPRPESHCPPGWSEKGWWEFESKKNTTYSAASTVTLSFSWCSVLFEFLAQNVRQRLKVTIFSLSWLLFPTIPVTRVSMVGGWIWYTNQQRPDPTLLTSLWLRQPQCLVEVFPHYERTTSPSLLWPAMWGIINFDWPGLISVMRCLVPHFSYGQTIILSSTCSSVSWSLYYVLLAKGKFHMWQFQYHCL